MPASLTRLLRHAASSFIAFATAVTAGSIVLIHAGARANQCQQPIAVPICHEGSHAICESFQHFMPNVDCRETFDAVKNDGVLDIEGFHRFDGVALLRPRLQELKDFDPMDKFVMIVRTDLMRWSLSNYYKQSFARNLTDSYLNDSVYLLNMDPQFKHITTPLPVHDVSLDVMHHNVQRLIALWRNKVKILSWLNERGRTYVIATYEQFLLSGINYTAAIIRAIGESSPQDFAPPMSISQNVTRVHSDDLHEYASNIDAVVRHFLVTPYESWNFWPSAAKNAYRQAGWYTVPPQTEIPKEVLRCGNVLACYRAQHPQEALVGVAVSGHDIRGSARNAGPLIRCKKGLNGSFKDQRSRLCPVGHSCNDLEPKYLEHTASAQSC